jgi:hypothetical protein
MAISQIVARENNVYVVLGSSGPHELKRTKVNCDEVIQIMKEYEREKEWVNHFLQDYSMSTSVTYEGICDAVEKRDKDFFGGLIDMSDAIFDDYQPPDTAKLIPNWRSLIINADELDERVLQNARD